MEVDKLINCKNCGAVLNTDAEQTIQCKYCGTVYHHTLPINNINVDTETTKEAMEAQSRWDDMKNGGGAYSVKKSNPVGWVIASIIFIFVIAAIIMKEQADHEQDKATQSDTAVIDTSALSMLYQPEQLSQPEEANLKKLTEVRLDRKLFTKLSKDSSNITREAAVQRTSIKDKNSIADKPISGLYTYINCDDAIGCNIFLCCQRIDKKALELHSLTFLINGKRSRYKPDLTTDSLNHLINEHGEDVINNDRILMLLKLATADNVIVRFNGNKGHDQIFLPKNQQDVLKRQLQLYKGLLLGYAK